MRPRIAIVDPNTLAALGLQQLLQQVMPIVEICTYANIYELDSNHPDTFVHYFVAQSVIMAHRKWFLDHAQKTIALTPSNDPATQPKGFHSLCTNQPEDKLVKSLLMLEQHAHAHGRNMPRNIEIPAEMAAAHAHVQKTLTDREIEVLSLVVKGCINKEIADRLNIGLTTVITHRKNLMEKLGVKSVSALTIYAVMNGYVDISEI